MPEAIDIRLTTPEPSVTHAGVCQSGYLCCPKCSADTNQLYLSSGVPYAPDRTYYTVWCPCGTVYVKYPRKLPITVFDFSSNPLLESTD